ncbi:alpha/beta hydrolase [Crocinitomicaceae bacterium CZZ-1]|uniref:Alpha/beta hydrolase n=1 Tax=Taishania pollutisoli TaxID=2766479 RepID=A0A8J6TYB2_9FLAO|nr:alpha/beta hydrolase [Taishania pollutisoli]MBC9813826.1 alpha/beta hydrolase [Taishania pollutisoli]
MKLVELAGKKLAVSPVFTEHVTDDSCVLVFLHEALGSIGQWKGFPQQLCNALHLNGIVYEREGYGHSSALRKQRTNRYLHEYAWEELPELLDTILPKEKQVVLIGHSDGASIALLYAARFPKRVKAVVSMAAHVLVEEITRKGIAPAVQAYKAGKLEGLRKYHGDKTEELFYAWANTWNLPEFRDWNICEDIETVTCPVLALQGVNDQYGTSLQLDLIEKAIRKGQVTKTMIPRCGHHPHLEVPEQTEHMIAEWWKRNT